MTSLGEFRHCEERSDEAIQSDAARLPAMASKRNGTIYVGVTSNLPQRAGQHREGTFDGFSKQYGCKFLLWFELHATMEHAITREKQIKGGSRARKLALIESANPQWCDLFVEVCG
jgi:putative endonuclease